MITKSCKMKVFVILTGKLLCSVQTDSFLPLAKRTLPSQTNPSPCVEPADHHCQINLSKREIAASNLLLACINKVLIYLIKICSSGWDNSFTTNTDRNMIK